MDRLTTRFSNGTAGLIMSKMPRLAPYANAITRLAAYEDTGLEPEEIKAMYETVSSVGAPLWKIKELSDADKDDRLIVLPSKVGDTVWRIGPGISKSRTIYPIKADKLQRIVMWMQCGDFGTTIFLTRKEAEAALGGDRE